MSVYTISVLLKQGKILDANGNTSFTATIFPESMRDKVSALKYDKDNIITFIDDSFYYDNDITILEKSDSYVSTTNGKKYIRSNKIGDYDNSVKRYTSINMPLSYNKDENSFDFLNLKKPVPKILDVENKQLIFSPGNDLIVQKNKNEREEQLFGSNFSHPHINNPKVTGSFKNNNKAIIKGIFEWIVSNDIKYVYSINEYRPYVINNNYVTNLVYYTVTGSK